MRRLAYLALLLAFAGTVAHAYVVNGTRWPSFPVTYRVNGSNADMTTEEATTDIDAAAAVWENSGATVNFTNAGTSAVTAAAYDGTNVIFFSSGSNGSLGAMTSRWSTGGQMLQFDIAIYDGAYEFLKNDESCSGSKLFLIDTITHEFGHVLGLTHSTDATATMRSSMAYCTSTMRDLAQDDINGINSLYPPVSPNPSTPTAPSALTVSALSSSALSASWTDNASTETGFAIQTSRDNSTWTNATSVGAGVTSATVSGLLPSTAYYVRVAAFNANGYSAFTSGVSGTTNGAVTQLIALTATGFSRGNKTYASLKWTATVATSMDLYRDNVKIVSALSGGTYRDTLASPRTYSYQVCQAGTTTCSNTASVTF